MKILSDVDGGAEPPGYDSLLHRKLYILGRGLGLVELGALSTRGCTSRAAQFRHGRGSLARPSPVHDKAFIL